MKTLLKLLIVVLLAGWSRFGYSQDYLNAPKPNEAVIGTITVDRATHPSRPMNPNDVQNGSTKLRWYQTLLEKAKREYPGKVVDIRSLTVGNYWVKDQYGEFFWGPAIGKVVELGSVSTENSMTKSLSKAIDKALMNVREGSRIAIDQVRVPSGENKEDYKDEVVEILLDKGFKVVAKEYLERLYEEQKSQQSGVFNDKTTVKEDNFSAVGYYLNVKLTETSLRIQVINVSTGEYDGNVTIKL